MFQNLLFACALTSTLGLASIKGDIKPSYKSDEVSFHLDNKKMVSYNDDDFSITLSADELNNYQWENFYNYWFDLYGDETENFDNYLQDGYLVYNSTNLQYADGGQVYWYFVVSSPTYYVIGFNWNNTIPNQTDDYKFYLSNEDDETIPFEYDLVFNFSSDYYSDFKSAIELDIQANNPSDNMPQVLDDFVGVLTTAIGSLASGIAGGVTAMAQDLFLQDDGEGNITGLSVFGGIVALFAGLALAVAITTKVYTWVTTLGN